MSNLGDLTDTHNKALLFTGNLLGTLADFSGAIGFVQLTIGFVEGLTSQDVTLQNLLNAIQAIYVDLQGQIGASDKLQRMRDVDQGINAAVGVFEQLPAIMSANPPPSEDFKLTQIQICLDAALFFADYDDKWQAVQVDLPYYSDSWTGKVAPQAQADGLVFNYMYTLPQALRSIYILLTAIGALAPRSLPYYANVLTRCLNRLESVHQTIVTSGIVGMRQPGIDEVGYNDPNTGAYNLNWVIEPDDNPNDTTYYPYGAVEMFSGASNLRSYAVDYFPYFEVDLGEWWNVNANNFLTLFNFRVVRQMKALYEQIGMRPVWNVMNQLRTIVGPPQATGLYPAWPFSEVESLLGLTLPPPIRKFPVNFPTPWSEPPGLEEALRTFLGYTPPYAGYPDMPTPPVALPTGSLYTFLTGVSLEPVAEL